MGLHGRLIDEQLAADLGVGEPVEVNVLQTRPGDGQARHLVRGSGEQVAQEVGRRLGGHLAPAAVLAPAHGGHPAQLGA